MAETPLDLAFDAARRAAAEGEVPVGAAILRDGQVLAVAHNRRGRSTTPRPMRKSWRSAPPAPPSGTNG